MKKYLSLLLSCLLFIVTIIPVNAEEIEQNEWFEMKEEDFDLNISEEDFIQPYTLYLVDGAAYIADLGSKKVGMHVEVYCSEPVKTISTTFYLQKKYSGTWNNVSSGTVSVSNSTRMSKSVSVSGVTSGTYRAKAIIRVTDAYGYSESITRYSGNLVI